MEHPLREVGRIRPSVPGGVDRPRPVAVRRYEVLLWQDAGVRCPSRRT